MTTAPTASSAQLRKIKKPLIERRRRERINDCLNQLKSLVLEASNKDESRYSKMEKADILEMTVSHLRALHRRRAHQPLQTVSSDDTADRYTAGFRQCAMEVGRYFSAAESTASGLGSAASAPGIVTPASSPNQHLMVGNRLMRHLASLLRLSPVAQLTTADRIAPSSSSAYSDNEEALVGSPQSPSFLRHRNSDFLSDEDELHPVDATMSTLSFEGLRVAVGRDRPLRNDDIPNDIVKLEQLNDKAPHAADCDVAFPVRTPATTPDSREATEWLTAAGGVVLPPYPSTTDGQSLSPSSSASSFPSQPLSRPLTGDSDKPVCFAVREYCNGFADALHGTQSPKQADEVPIRRQLTSLAAIAASASSKGLLPPLAPAGSWALTRSVLFNGEASIYSSDDFLHLPTSGTGGIHCGGVWRPW